MVNLKSPIVLFGLAGIFAVGHYSCKRVNDPAHTVKNPPIVQSQNDTPLNYKDVQELTMLVHAKLEQLHESLPEARDRGFSDDAFFHSVVAALDEETKDYLDLRQIPYGNFRIVIENGTPEWTYDLRLKFMVDEFNRGSDLLSGKVRYPRINCIRD